LVRVFLGVIDLNYLVIMLRLFVYTPLKTINKIGQIKLIYFVLNLNQIHQFYLIHFCLWSGMEGVYYIY